MIQSERPLKILHCPTTVGGNPQGLARAERELGHDSYSITLTQNYLGYEADQVILKPSDSFLRRQFLCWKAAFKSLCGWPVIHYNFGQSFAPTQVSPPRGRYAGWKIWAYNNLYARWLEMLDVALADYLGRIIAVTYQGDDARQGDYCRAHYAIHPGQEVESNYYSPELDRLKRSHIAKFDRHADLIYAVNPDLLNVLPERARFMAYASVDPRVWVPVYGSSAAPEIPHIVHAPSHRLVKGTRFILDAFERLRAEGVPFRYTLVEGLSNNEARKIYETADLLVDQVLAGFYGGLAVELMALGKPVICYIREEDLHYLPEGMRRDMPLINATPETIYEVLKDWLTTRKGELRAKGRESRIYVENWHDPLKIAASLIADYQAAIDRKKGGS